MGRTAALHTMGTVLSLSGAHLPDDAVPMVAAICEGYEQRYSLFREDSELSRINRREILLRHASQEMQVCYAEAHRWRRVTDGAFSPQRPDGVIDLSGLVKARAMEACRAALVGRGISNFCLNCGGDVVVSGSDPDRDTDGWVVGLVDPLDRSRLHSQYRCNVERAAVATSGTAERGEHVWRIAADDTYCQVTVAAADIITADVLATAILAGGPGTLSAMCRRFDIDVLASTAQGQHTGTAAFAA